LKDVRNDTKREWKEFKRDLNNRIDEIQKDIDN
jgi:hypothetical protein